ncbi:MAG: helix-turn-helix transcriptional regulator [Acidimicrobiia bacterium]
MDARLTDEQILGELGSRLRRERLDRDWTLAEVAERSGVSERTIRAAETGESFTMATLLSMLRAYGLLGRLDALVPDAGPSPIQLADRQGAPRQRASRRREPTVDWEW